MLYSFAVAPVLIAILLYILPFERIARLIAVAAQIALVGAASYVFILTRNEDIVTSVGNFRGLLGITLRADTLSAVFLVLTSVIFLIVAVFSFKKIISRLYWFFLFIWEGMLNGVFLSGDIFNIFVMIEVATVVVAVLIMFNRSNRSMYDGMIYLMVNTVAMQFYLFGVGYVYKLTGVLDLETATRILSQYDKNMLILPCALILTAIALKCALVPLLSWLPKAHGTAGAPSGVSAILSGLHIKAGVYLFIRFQSLFEVIDLSGFFMLIGIATAITGFVFAVSQSDIKLIMAYSTISQNGMIMIGLNVDDAYSQTGSIYHIINHAFFKTALFLCAGIIADVYKTRNINQIRGVFRRMPLVGTASVMAIFGIVGAPIFNGSISKYFIAAGLDGAVTYIIMLINLGTIIIFIKYSAILFGRCTINPDEEVVKIDGFQQSAVLILGALCFAGGLFGEQFIQLLFNVTVNVDAAGYLEKSLTFAASVAAGFFIHKYYIQRSVLFKQIGEIEMGFRGMCASMGVFFALILVFMQIQ